MSRSLKKLVEACEAHDKITTAEKLGQALPDLLELKDAIATMDSLAKTAKTVYKKLTDGCAAYAMKHPSCFDSGLFPQQKNTNVGDITIDDVVYHFVNGVTGFVRADGLNLSQEFLGTLPENWTRRELKLNANGIAADCEGANEADTLAEHGLKRKAYCEWSIKD